MNAKTRLSRGRAVLNRALKYLSAEVYYAQVC